MASKPKASAKPKNVAKAAKRPSTRVPTKNRAPKAQKKGGTAEQQIASGERDADHFVKWGDLKGLKG